MALTEQRILKSVQVLSQQSAANVQWANQILRDGELVTETYERKAYIAEQYHDFLAEVEGAEAYIAVLGWTEPAPVDPEPEEAPEPDPEPEEAPEPDPEPEEAPEPDPEPEEAPVEEPAPVEPDPEQ